MFLRSLDSEGITSEGNLKKEIFSTQISTPHMPTKYYSRSLNRNRLRPYTSIGIEFTGLVQIT